LREIVLTKGYKCFVDDVMYDVICTRNWHVLVCNSDVLLGKYLARRRLVIMGMGVLLYIHRLSAGVPKMFKVRFRNGNTLDYRHENLRICDFNNNEYEHRVFSPESSYKGVVFDYYYGLWRADFFGLVIGYYGNEVDAARAYNIKVIEICGGVVLKSRVNRIRVLEEYKRLNPYSKYPLRGEY